MIEHDELDTRTPRERGRRPERVQVEVRLWTGLPAYVLAAAGTLAYFWHTADGAWEHAFAILQGVLWPAWLVYDLLASLPRWA